MIISSFLGASGLSGVGYQFFDSAEAASGSRVTSGITDAGDGWYTASATLPGNSISVRWNSTVTPEAVAREYYRCLGDPLIMDCPDGYPTGSAGKLIGNLPSAAPGAAGGMFIAGSNAPTNVNFTGNINGNINGDVTGSVTDVVNTDAIAVAVRDVSNVAPAANSLGADVKAGIGGGSGGGASWDEMLPGSHAPGTAGYILGHNLDAQVSTRLPTSGYTTPPSAVTIGVACRDTDNTSPVVGSVGDKINHAAGSGDPWNTVLPGAYATNTAGKILGDRLDVLVSSRLATAAYTVAPSATVIAQATRDIDNTAPAVNSLGAAVNNAAAACDPWVANIGTYTTPGTAGKLMNDNLNATVSSRLAASAYTIPPTTAAIAAANRDVSNASPASGSLGEAVNSAASAGDPWSTLLPSVTYPPGTAGNIIGVNIDAKISDTLASDAYVVPPTTSQISEAVRDVDNSAPASNSLGADVKAGGTDPLANLVPGSYAPNTAGKILGDNLNATVSSRSTYAGTDTPGTTTLLTRVPGPITTTGGKVDVNDKTGFSLTPAYDAAKTAAQPGDAMSLTPMERATLSGAIWQTLTSAMTFVGSIGKHIVDNLNASVGSRLPTSSYVPPDNAGIASIKAKTDTIPANPVSVSDVPTAAMNAAATRDVSNASPPAGSLGADIKAGAVSSDPWSTSLPSSYPNGTAGHILGVNLDATVSSRLPTSAIALDNGEVTVGTNNDKLEYGLAAGEANAIADAILKRDFQAISGEPAYCVLNALRLVRNKWEVTPDGTLKVYREDGATLAWSRSVVADSEALPIVGVS